MEFSTRIGPGFRSNLDLAWPIMNILQKETIESELRALGIMDLGVRPHEESCDVGRHVMPIMAFGQQSG